MTVRGVFVAAAVASAVGLLVSEGLAHPDTAPSPQTLDPAWIEQFTWRPIGPANMGGRITGLAIVADNPSTFFIATATGGLLKTTNNGTTFEYQFTHEATSSIGAVAVAPSDPRIVWVGTGEANPRNSVSWGNGVYQSTDGGTTWTHKGLETSFQIAGVLIDPENPDTVLVSAMGRAWGPGGERGVYRTTDAGETWQRVLFVDDNTGAIDLQADPNDPDTILAAMWERQRDEFDTNDPAKRWGPGSGLYRSTDGGKTFKPVTKGLPTVHMGRIALCWSPSEEDTVYALVDTDRIGTGVPNPAYMGITGQDADVGARLTSITEDGPAEQAGLEEGDIVITIDGEPVLSYDDLVSGIRIRQADETATVGVARQGEALEFEVTFVEHPDPNRKPFERDLGGQRSGIMDQQGNDGFETGGLYKSTDRGRSWTRINSVNPRPMYFSMLRVDPKDPSRIYVGGIILERSDDGGESFTRDGAPGVHADLHAMWIDPHDTAHMILGSDGGLYVTYDRGSTWDHLNHMDLGQFYHVAVDNQPLYRVFGGLQDNGSWGGPNRTRDGGGTVNSDWFRIGGGDGFICAIDPEDPDQIYYESQNGGMGRVNLRTGARRSIRPRAPRGTRYRFNWRTPFLLSHHNPKIYYTAGNLVFRSIHMGDDLKAISPEISRTDRGSATALAESPLDHDVLFVGTDDGAFWMTRDGGSNWTNILFPYEATEDEDDGDAPESDEPAPTADTTSDAGDETPEPTIDAPISAGRMARMIRTMDRDGDGTIRKDEVPQRMQPVFDSLDTNKNGALDIDELVALAGRFERPRGTTPQRGDRPTRRPRRAAAPEPEAAPEKPTEPDAPDATTADPVDPLVGTWDAKLVGEMAEVSDGFTLIFTRDDKGKLAASIDSQVMDASTREVSFKEETGSLRFGFTSDFGQSSFVAQVSGSTMTGTLSFGGGQFEAQFEATRPEPEQAQTPDEDSDAGPTLADLVTSPKRISSIEPSRFEADRVYLTLDGHYSDDDAPHVFVSDDKGASWRSLADGLPTGTTRVLREDLVNPDVLYLGTEFAIWVSVDRGLSWTKLNNNLPTVPIHEIAQHATSGEIIAGTHGRSLWALDITPIQQMTKRTLAEPIHLFTPNTVIRWRTGATRGRGGARWFSGQNPPNAASIYYTLTDSAGAVELTIRDTDGRVIRTLGEPSTSAGLHRVSWDLRRDPPQGRRGRFRRGPLVPPGQYRVVLRVDGMEFGRTLRVLGDPDDPLANFAADEFLNEASTKIKRDSASDID